MALSINSLPVEILENIFTHLPFKDVRHFGQVCHIWNDVLRGSQFQRRIRVKLQNDFRQDISPASMKFLTTCKNLSIVQQYDNSSNYDAEVEGESETDSQRLQDAAKAEQNIAFILFGTTELDSLQLFSKYKSVKNIIQDRLFELSHLKELKFSFFYDGNTCQPGEKVWHLKSDSLETFKIGLPYSVGPLHLETPHLKELHLTVSCDVLMNPVEQYSNQLTVLKINLFDIETLDKIMTCSFPCLENLELAMYDDKEIQSSYAQTADRAIDDERSRQFTQHMPLLKVFAVHSNVAFYKIFPTWCSLRTSLQELELYNLEIDANVLINVLLVQPLKSLILQQCELINDLPGLHIRMVGLERLKLISVVNNVLLEHNFCGLRYLELAHSFKYGNDLLQKVFYNFTSVEHAKIHFRTTLDGDAFQKLHQMKSLKSLEMRATEVTDEHWNHCQQLPSVEQFTITNCFMLKFSMFASLGRVFPSVKRLYVDRCHIIDDTSGADAAIDGGCERKLRKMFPNCIVSWHDSVQLTPMSLKQLLM
ncbi:uncharacterized protein LOC135712739 isoform X1 [Ochlerotatus camptorhynchus]|uniref:uncharacterized protein LOC135712739 isoform X1 n=1 Tax=Ochlerotatus camptorhynchus TaxID=644619 RepID=UPI0031DC883E